MLDDSACGELADLSLVNGRDSSTRVLASEPWVPAFAGMTGGGWMASIVGVVSWVPAFAGMTVVGVAAPSTVARMLPLPRCAVEDQPTAELEDHSQLSSSRE